MTSKSKRYVVKDEILLEEIAYVKSKQKELQEQINHITTMLALREAAEEAGTTIECQCCYGDFAFEEMCQVSISLITHPLRGLHFLGPKTPNQTTNH